MSDDDDDWQISKTIFKYNPIGEKDPETSHKRWKKQFLIMRIQ
jgi:hypothetical protein